MSWLECIWCVDGVNEAWVEFFGCLVSVEMQIYLSSLCKLVGRVPTMGFTESKGAYSLHKQTLAEQKLNSSLTKSQGTSSH